MVSKATVSLPPHFYKMSIQCVINGYEINYYDLHTYNSLLIRQNYENNK